MITGASSGIGTATARELASRGYNLILTARRADRLQIMEDELEDLYDIKVHIIRLDICDRDQVESAIAALPENFSDIDVLVNNAGLAVGLEDIQEGDTADWDRMIDTNIKGLLYITRVVTRKMVGRGRGGIIINMSSIAGTQVYRQGAVYCASKHAVSALSAGMRIDLLQHGIKVTEIRPGMVETEFSIVRFHGDCQRAKEVYENTEPLQPENVAEVVGWVVSLPANVNINEIEITPIGQANAYYSTKNKK